MPRPTQPYVPTREGWLYLAIVLELASRRVIGWAMRETLDADARHEPCAASSAWYAPTRDDARRAIFAYIETWV